MELYAAEPTIVSKRWTPEHKDVTDEPVRYAQPRGSWIDHRDLLRVALAITDERDRAQRRRSTWRAVVDICEVPTAPVYEPVPTQTPARIRAERALMAIFERARSPRRSISPRTPRLTA